MLDPGALNVHQRPLAIRQRQCITVRVDELVVLWLELHVQRLDWRPIPRDRPILVQRPQRQVVLVPRAVVVALASPRTPPGIRHDDRVGLTVALVVSCEHDTFATVGILDEVVFVSVPCSSGVLVERAIGDLPMLTCVPGNRGRVTTDVVEHEHPRAAVASRTRKRLLDSLDPFVPSERE